MSLLKLWNSIRGKTCAESAPEPSVQPAKPPPSGQPARSPEAVPAVAAKIQPAAVKKKRGLFGRSAPESPLLKMLAGYSAISVLEIGVGDGARAIELVTHFQQQSDGRVRYAAIDQFEMGGNETTLMQFHQTLRAASIRPQVFPDPIESGLLRVAHTLGAMDLILISDPDIPCHSDEFRGLLSRVTHAESRVIRLDGTAWTQIHVESVSPVRRAA